MSYEEVQPRFEKLMKEVLSDKKLTAGRAIWYPEYAGYEKLPKELKDKVVREIRTRKGIPPEPPTPQQVLE